MSVFFFFKKNLWLYNLPSKSWLYENQEKFALLESISIGNLASLLRGGEEDVDLRADGVGEMSGEGEGEVEGEENGSDRVQRQEFGGRSSATVVYGTTKAEHVKADDLQLRPREEHGS